MADNINQQLQQEGALPTLNPMVPSSGKFEFQPISDFTVSPDLPEYSELMSPEYKAMLDIHAKKINSAIPRPVGNMNDPNPTLSTSTYNPYRQSVGLDLSTPEGKLQLLSNTGKFTKPTGEVKIANPIYAGIRSHNFDRYYKHPEFSKLGWHPYADNEEYYNANSTWWDDASRMRVQFANLAGTGFLSAYRSIGDLFDSDDYFTGKDLESASEFADAMRIGNSTRGGVSGFTNNLALQFGYTAGVIGSIAAEELALWGAAAAQGFLNPVSDVVAAERTAFNFAKLGKTILNTFDLSRLANATRNMYRGLRSVDGAKDLYNTVKAGGNFLGNIIAPETVQAIKTLNSTANGAQNLSNMAKVSKTFGGFYRDVRSLNLALAESKMEGGTVYSQQLANGYALQSQLNNGSPITTDQMQNIEEKASRAAYYTTLLNAPTIYLSNQLVLGNAFGAYNRTLSRMLGDNIQGIGGRILKTKGLRDAAGKVVTRPFEYVGDGVKGYLKTLKAAGIKGSAKLAGQASLRYFAANLSEGLQEITQEAIAEGTKHYHQTLIEHPTAGGHDLMSASIASAVGSQFSAQGFETFMSGFLMGGIAQGPQKLFFQGVPSIYNYGALGFGTEKQKANLVEYNKNKEELINGLVNSLNDVYEVTANNPMESIFDTNKINHIIQSQASIDMLQAAFDQSNFDFVDAKDFSKFQAIYTVLGNNKGGEFRQQFEDYLKLTDQELAEAFPSFKAEIKSGKIRTRLQDMITKVDQLEESYYTNKSKFSNPFDPNIYKYGSREWNEEKIKQMSFEHARYLYMFTEDGFKRALERSQSIYDELAADPIIGKMAASDITVLLDENSLQKEIATLLAEIGTLDPKEGKDIIEAKTAKLEGLNGILSVLYAEENLTKDGGFNRRKIGKLTSAFEKYVQKLAKSNGTFADLDKVSNALKKIVDYRELKGRAIAYNKSIEYMNNPERFNEITQRSYDFFKNIYKNRIDVFRNSIKKYIGKIEINQFLNELAKIEVYPDPEQVKEFMENGNIDVLQDFFTEKGIVNPISDKDIYTQIQVLILIYKSAVESKVTKDSTKEETKTKQNEKINFDDIDVQEIPEDIQAELKQSPDANILYKDQSPFAQKLLLNLYSEYKLREFAKGNSYLSLSEWVNGSQGASAVKSLEKVKKFWHISLKASSLSAQEIDVAYKNDQGFQEWILTQKEEPMIYRALMLGGLSFENIEMNTTGVGLDSVAEDNPNLRWIQKGPGINILERRVGDPTSEEYQTILYTLTDNNGKQLSDEQLKSAGLTSANFSSITKATEAYKKALQKAPVDATYLFDGVDLKYLDEVENAQGDKFIVLGTSVSTNKGTKLKLLRFEDRGLIDQEKEAASFFVNEDGFSDLYTKVIESFEGVKFTENMSKLDPKDMSAVYARRFGEETSDVAASRFTRVLSILTPEELGKAQIVIFRNNRKEPKKLQYGITPENTFVNVNGDKYQIEIVLDPISTEKVRQALADTEYAYPEDFTGSIGFIANDQFSFTGVKGKEVNITSIDDAKIERYIISENSTAADLKNAALQQTYFIGKVDSLIDNSESKILTMSEFLNETGFDLKLTNGKFDQGGSPVSLEELDYNTFDGNMIVMINTKQKSGGVGLSYVTNLEGQAELDFINSVQKQLQDQAVSGGQSNLFNEARTLGRYVAIIKSPNGAITLAQLKQAPFSAEQRTELYRELLEKAQDVAAGKVEKKDLYAWNDNFKDKFYIPINPNLSPAFLDLKIDLKGNIILRVKVGKSAPTAFISQVSIPAEQLATFMENPTSVGSLFSNLTNSIEVQNFNASSPYKLKFSEESLLQVFPLNASLEEIVSKTKTDLDKRVRFGQRAYLTTNADIVNGEGLVSNSVDDTTSDEYTESVETPITAGVFTPTELFTDAEGNIIPKGPEITTSTESQTQPITSNQSDIEAQKADIEKRRQERLNPILETNPKGYFENTGVYKKDKVTGEEYYEPDTKNGTYSVDFSEDEDVDDFINASSIKELKDKINAKYDAELAALESTATNQKTNPINWKKGDEIIITVFGRRISEYKTNIIDIYFDGASFSIQYKDVSGNIKIIDNVDETGVFEEPFDADNGTFRSVKLAALGTTIAKESKTPIKQSLNYKGVNPTVDLIVTKVVNGETQVLLIKRGDNVATEAGKLAFPGGFHDTDAKKGSAWKAGKETAEEAAIRELKEETGLDLNKSNMGITLEKVGTFDDKARDPRNSEDSWVSATVFRVNLPENFDVSTEVSGQDDAKDAQWIPVSILNSLDISRFGFDHAAILESEGIAFPMTYSKMTEEELAAEEQVEEIAEEIISFNIGGESFQFSNKDDDADSELDEYLNEEEDEDEDFLPPTATPEQIKNFSDRASEQLVKGLDLRGQSALINYLASRISTEALKKGGAVNSKEVFAAEEAKLNKLIDTLEAKGLENKAKRIKVILKQWQKVSFLTNQHLSLFSTGTIMNAKDDSVENGLERTHYNDDWTFTVSSKNTASAELKKFFSFIQDVDAEGNLVYNPLLGLPEVVPFDEVYDTLHEVLANRPSDFNTMLQYIELYQNRYPWFSSVAKQLKAAPDNIKNQFVTDMTKHHIQMNFIMWSKDANGNYQLQNWSSNSSSIEQRLKDSWDSNLRSLGGSNLITTNENNEYVFDEKTVDALTAQAEEWKTNPPSADKAGFMEVAEWLGNYGIVLTDNTYEDLAAGKYKNKMLLSWKELFTNSNSFIDVLSKQLNKNKTILVDDAAILNDSAVKALAVLEARNTANVFSNSFNAGTKTIYSYSNNNYLVNRVRDLTAVDDNGDFTNPELIDALNKIPFTSASQWLADLQKDTAAGRLLRDTLKLGYVSLEALKKQYTPSKDNRKLNQLTTIEHEVIKLGMFFNASKNIIDGENRRIVNFFYPTMSDKSTMLTMQTLSRQFDLGEDGSLSDENLELLYNAMVLPELKRMASDKANNVSGYQPDYFYFMPALNEAVITINDQEYNLRDYVLDGKVFENADAKKEILVILKDTYNEIVAQKLEDWEKLGIGKTDAATNEKFALLDKSYMATAQGLGQDKVTYAAQDYVFNSLIANAEMFMLFAGDPALYSKFKSDKSIQENLEESFINLGKRLAGDIAPGMELANSATNSYYQVFFNDKKLDSNNVTNKAVSEYFTKIMSDFKANYSDIEGSDAQEYTTWQEHIYVLNKLGRLTNKQYKDIKKKLENEEELGYEELGFVLQPLKPVYVGNLADVDNHVDRRVYIKSSSFPLLPQLTATLEIDKIRIALEKFQQKKNDAGEKTLAGDPITVRASFNTANKVGGVSKSTDVFDNNGDVIDNLVIDDANALLLERANFRIQQDVPYDREKHEVNIGTQARKLLLVNMLDVEIEPGVTGEQLQKEYNDLYQNLFKYRHEQLMNKLGLVKTSFTEEPVTFFDVNKEDTIFDKLKERDAKLAEVKSTLTSRAIRSEYEEKLGDAEIKKAEFINNNFDLIVEQLLAAKVNVFFEEKFEKTKDCK